MKDWKDVVGLTTGGGAIWLEVEAREDVLAQPEEWTETSPVLGEGGKE